MNQDHTTRQCRFCLISDLEIITKAGPALKTLNHAARYAVMPEPDCCFSCLMTLGRLAHLQSFDYKTSGQLTPDSPCIVCKKTRAEADAEVFKASQQIMTTPLHNGMAYDGLCYECCLDLGTTSWRSTKRHFAAAIAAAQDASQLLKGLLKEEATRHE